MATFPTSEYTTDISSANKSAVAGTDTNDGATYTTHATHHVELGEEMIAVQEKLGTTASTPVANSVLSGTGAGTSEWDTSPTVNSLTTTGALAGASAAITGTMTAASAALSDSLVLNNDYAMVPNGDGNIEIRIGGAAGTLQEILVPTTGNIQAALDDLAGAGVVTLLPGTHTPANDVDVTNTNTVIRGYGMYQTIISASAFSTSGQAIIDIGDGIDGIQLNDLTLTLGTNSTYGIDCESTTTGNSNFVINNVRITGLASGKTGIRTDASNANLLWYVQNLLITGTAGTGLDMNNLQSYNMNHVTIDVNTGTHWDLDASCANGYFQVVADLAGTNNGGATNNIREQVF